MNKREVINKIKELSKEKVVSKRCSNRLNYYAKKCFGSWNNAIKTAGYKTKDFQKIKLFNKNNDFYYFLGILITDGHVVYNQRERAYRISVYTSYNEEKELLSNLIKNIFNYNPGVYGRDTEFSKNKNYDIYLNSKYVSNELIKMGFPIGNRLKGNYNPICKNIPKKQIPNFLRGIIDGDGSISKSMVRIHSGSKNFLLNMKFLLKRLNMVSGIIRKEKTCYTLVISTKENLIKLFNVLNYSNIHYPRKLKKWDTHIFKYYQTPMVCPTIAQITL